MRTTEVDCGILDARLIQDPPETWEMPYTRREGQPFFSAGVSSYPCVPRTLDEIPAGALESLREVCAIEGMHQILVIPWAVRPIGFGERKTITPTSVLAVGTAAVGLWTDKPVAGIKASIPVAELAAIQDITVLLYGRLSFLSRNGRLTIRYNTTVRHVFEPALLELRRRRSGSGLPLPREEVSSELEFKWRNILRSTLVRLDVDAPLRFRFARTPPRSRGASPRGHLVA